MLTNWITLLQATFGASATKTSAGLYCPNAEAIEYEVTLTGGTGKIAVAKCLFDPALTEDAGPFLGTGGTQATAPDLATLPDSASVSFADIVNQVLSTNPRGGKVVFTNRAGGISGQGNCPFQFTYLQLTSDAAAASAALKVRARVKYAGDGPVIAMRALEGSTV